MQFNSNVILVVFGVTFEQAIKDKADSEVFRFFLLKVLVGFF